MTCFAVGAVLHPSPVVAEVPESIGMGLLRFFCAAFRAFEPEGHRAVADFGEVRPVHTVVQQTVLLLAEPLFPLFLIGELLGGIMPQPYLPRQRRASRADRFSMAW